jgi:hypothetical protein
VRYLGHHLNPTYPNEGYKQNRKGQNNLKVKQKAYDEIFVWNAGFTESGLPVWPLLANALGVLMIFLLKGKIKDDKN